MEGDFVSDDNSAQQKTVTPARTADDHRFECPTPHLGCKHREEGWCLFWVHAMMDPKSWEYIEWLGIYAIDTFREPCLE